ncbi:MAG: EAL domain-containing protein [Hespellia sp.]|nr:EAL domain-containing protein [Hespellia sp.]
MKKKILVVDDNMINRKLLCKILQESYTTIEAENGRVALELLEQKREEFSVILLDLIMPEMDGYEFLEVQQRNKELSMIPVIVMTGQEDDATEIKALSLGASDFLSKPYKPEIIKHRVANTIKLRENAAMINRIQKDQLTGIYNKNYFYERCSELIKDKPANAYDMICTDIERFKVVNDLYGTEKGDELLIFVANVIQNLCSPEEICGRIGSDSFGILTPHKETYQDAYFTDIIEKVNHFDINMQLTLRFGINNVEDVHLPVNVICDRAMLAADPIKGKYDVHFSFYNDTIRQQMLTEQMITDNMQKALDEKQFTIYYQPKYDITTESIAGAEALVRWIHPINGFMSPGEFIPLFEKNGFITQLDMYVWEEACAELEKWQKAGHEMVVISVNVSRMDIYNPDLPDIIAQIVKKHHLQPKNLHLEITETSYTENPQQLIKTVNELKRRGFLIEMDDFGTGYSSLNMLSELPIDILKLDMKFVQNEAMNPEGKNIMSFIISLAKWLDLTVVAEGIETAEQVRMLRNMDCTYVQGFYYAKPMPSDEFEQLLLTTPLTEMVAAGSKIVSMTPKPKRKNITGKIMMIVDDIALNRTILAETFLDYYYIVEAEDGQQAIDYIERHPGEVSLILLDLIMPRMDGFQTLEYLKKNRETANIPVVITSIAGEKSEERALKMGAADFISKPYTPSVCVRRIENVMASEKMKGLEKNIREV